MDLPVIMTIRDKKGYVKVLVCHHYKVEGPPSGCS